MQEGSLTCLLIVMTISEQYQKGVGVQFAPAPSSMGHVNVVHFVKDGRVCCLIGNKEFAIEFGNAIQEAGEYAGIESGPFVCRFARGDRQRRDNTLKFFSQKIDGGFGENVWSLFKTRLYNTNGYELPNRSVLAAG